MNKGAKIAVGIWDIIYPLALYYAATVIFMFAGQLVFGAENERYMLVEIMATALTIPIMYQSFYKPDKMVKTFIGSSHMNTQKEKCVNIGFIIVIAAFMSIGLNNLILMSPLASASKGYEEASNHFYSGTLFMELFGLAVLVPILEELVYRGIIYNRLKHLFGLIPAMILGSLIFAVMHFNLVQFIYAFLFGFVLIMFMEKTGHVYGAIVGHITANLIAVIRTETGLLEQLTDKSIFAWLLSVIILIIGVIGLLGYWIKKR